ncbi:Short-chain dehydrogenase/reductase SDR (fragment) [uncultured Sphingopyxis sp.]|uniref:Short-chain dehydrogenase/reductase SDR n=1 Tax=uncultured Sphingopyxis sp. TaxID=310581 RepID=A0A1Y5PYL4_9SPHN
MPSSSFSKKSNGALAPSDPTRVAAVLIELAASGDMPQRLVVGADAWGEITAKLDSQRAEYEAWKALSHSTGFA